MLRDTSEPAAQHAGSRATNSFGSGVGSTWPSNDLIKLGHILDAFESEVDRAGEKTAVGSGPATIAVSALEDDDFGDFASASTPSNFPAPQLLLDLSGYDP